MQVVKVICGRRLEERRGHLARQASDGLRVEARAPAQQQQPARRVQRACTMTLQVTSYELHVTRYKL